MVKRIKRKTTEKRVTGAQNMETNALVDVWAKIESVRTGNEDCISFLYGDDVAYLCNQQAVPVYTVGERPGKWWDFRKVQLEIEAELLSRYGSHEKLATCYKEN